MQRPVRRRTSPTKKAVVRELARLKEVPNVGPAIAADLRRLGINQPTDLPGRDPYGLYDDLCRITAQQHDPCLLDNVHCRRPVHGGRGGLLTNLVPPPRTVRWHRGQWEPVRFPNKMCLSGQPLRPETVSPEGSRWR